LKITFAVVCEYHKSNSDLLVPFVKFYPEKYLILKELQDSGHILAMHSVNHSTNYYITHIDSLSSEDQNFVNNGYTSANGIDTIIINNTNDVVHKWYWKILPDDRYAFFGWERIIDTDDEPDSIWYPRSIPPKSVYFSIYPNEAGLKKIIAEQRRRFVLSTLISPDVWIHPGQEYELTDNPLDTLTENIG
jgi:hypothetical protein